MDLMDETAVQFKVVDGEKMVRLSDYISLSRRQLETQLSEKHLKFEFRWRHRQTTVMVLPKMFRPSVYRFPFLSARALCIWVTHDWNPYGPPIQR